MPVVQDELWKNPGNPGMIVISSHASLQENGRLFMSYGEALEAVKRIPEIEALCGRAVSDHAVEGVYGFLAVKPPRPKERKIGFGLFQTCVHWNEGSDLQILQYSMDCLRQYLENQPEIKVRMNFPGISDGLSVDEVSKVLVPLPPTITICHQGEVPRSMPTSFTGFKELYLQVEEMLLEGRFSQAVEHLIGHGYDIQSAMDQVNAVERLMRERKDREMRRTARAGSVWGSRPVGQ
jgi:hypothetical protein